MYNTTFWGYLSLENVIKMLFQLSQVKLTPQGHPSNVSLLKSVCLFFWHGTSWEIIFWTNYGSNFHKNWQSCSLDAYGGPDKDTYLIFGIKAHTSPSPPQKILKLYFFGWKWASMGLYAKNKNKISLVRPTVLVQWTTLPFFMKIRTIVSPESELHHM